MFSFGSTSQNTNVLGPPVGTSVPYKVVLGGEEKPRLGNLTIKYKVKFWPITFMSQYSNKSFEELRFEDYSNGRKNKIIQVPSDDTPQLATTMSNFSPSSYTLLHDVQMINADTQSTSLYRTAGNECFGSKAAVTVLNSSPFGIYNGHILGSTCNFGTGNPHEGTIGTAKGVSTNSRTRISEGPTSLGSFNFGLASNNTSNLGSLANSNSNNFAFNGSSNSPLLGGRVTAGTDTVPSKPILPAFNFSNFSGSNQIAPSAHLTSPTSPTFDFGNNNVDSNKSFTPFNFGTSKTESFGQPPILAQATTVNSPFLLHTLPNHSSTVQSGAVNDFLHISPITPYPNLYPIFTNARLVGYTTNEIAFNPALHLKTEPFIQNSETESRKLAATWKNFYEHIKETGGSLYPSIKAGEFILDESPSVKRKEKEILNASATVWNNPLLDNADFENDEASHNHNVKVETWRKWEEAVEFKFQHNHYPFIESKFQNKQRILLLQTHNIFKTQAGQIEQNSKLNTNFTVFSNGSNFYQTESEQLTTNPRPPQPRSQSGESQGRHQRRAKTERNSSTGKQLANTDLPTLSSDGAFGRNLRFSARLNSNTPRRYHRKTKSNNNKMEENRSEAIFYPDASSEKENCADENLIPLLTRTTPSHKNKTGNNSDDSYDSTKRVDRCRRPRSKSLSVRPRGKSCGVHLTRERYYCIPSIPTMDRMVDEEGRCLVENFEVGHLDYGHMVFQGIMDVAGINLDELIVFKLKEMFLYPATDADFDLPLRLQKLNQPAIVTLFQVWPQRVGTNEFIRDVHSINTINYENLLKKTCGKMGVSFLSYDPNKGQWQFKIQDKASVSQCDSLLS